MLAKQFELWYQPVVDLDSGALLGFEALIRWRHPTRGLVAPSEFIPVADDTGAIVGIGSWVIDEACAMLAERHGRDRSLTVSVNVSPFQLSDPDFADVVVAAVRRHQIPPDKLVLEITEAAAMTNTEEGSTALAKLRAHGVHVALDDFGTGFSSLRWLDELPVDVIKIDRSFVTGQEDDRDSMLEAIINLGQRLGLQIIAEGIETPPSWSGSAGSDP